jgi:hypothetical protein
MKTARAPACGAAMIRVLERGNLFFAYRPPRTLTRRRHLIEPLVTGDWR